METTQKVLDEKTDSGVLKLNEITVNELKNLIDELNAAKGGDGDPVVFTIDNFGEATSHNDRVQKIKESFGVTDSKSQQGSDTNPEGKYKCTDLKCKGTINITPNDASNGGKRRSRKRRSSKKKRKNKKSKKSRKAKKSRKSRK